MAQDITRPRGRSSRETIYLCRLSLPVIPAGQRVQAVTVRDGKTSGDLGQAPMFVPDN